MSNENNQVVDGIDKTLNGDGFREILKVLKNNPSSVFAFFAFLTFPLIIVLLFALLGYTSYNNKEDRISMQVKIDLLVSKVEKLSTKIEVTNEKAADMVDILQDIKSEIIRKSRE